MKYQSVTTHTRHSDPPIIKFINLDRNNDNMASIKWGESNTFGKQTDKLTHDNICTEWD